MTEIVRRPGRLPVFLQVLIAVLAGAAAMYVIMNVQASPQWAQLLVKLYKPAPSAPAPSAPKAPPPPSPARPARLGASPKRGPAPAASSMLVKPEPGGAPQGMLHAAGDDPEHKARFDGSPAYAPVPRQDPEDIRLKPVKGFTRDFDAVEWGSLRFKRRRHPAARPSAARPPAGTPKFAPKLIEKEPIPEEDLLGPALIDPSRPEEEPFWTRERRWRVGIAAVLAAAGAAFLLLGSGLWMRPREPQRRP